MGEDRPHRHAVPGPPQEYEAGLSALRTGNVEGGVEKLKQFARDHPRHPRADNALYFAAVGLIALGDTGSAAATLEAMLREYPAGDAVSDAMLKLAECRTRQSRARDARSIYGEVIQRYPGTAAGSHATRERGTPGGVVLSSMASRLSSCMITSRNVAHSIWVMQDGNIHMRLLMERYRNSS